MALNRKEQFSRRRRAGSRRADDGFRRCGGDGVCVGGAGTERAGSETQSSDEVRATTTSRADAYFNYTMGHMRSSSTSRRAAAIRDPGNRILQEGLCAGPEVAGDGERLAEMYWKAQRVHEAEAEAQGLLKRDPNDVQTRRLLGHIFCAAWANRMETVNRKL